MKHRLKTLGTVLSGICLAAALLWLSVPRMEAEAIALPPLSRIADQSRVDGLSIEEARELAIEFERAADRFNARRYTDGALRMYYKMQLMAPAAIRTEYRDIMTAAIRRELSVRPMQSRVWNSFSSFVFVKDRKPTDLSRDALVKSIELRENALSLVPVRLRLILYHWHVLPQAVRANLKPQFEQTWRRDPYGLIRLAKTRGGAPIIRGGLSNQPEMLGGLEIGLGNR